MKIEKLSFYDGYGKPLNLEYDTDNELWKGSLYFKEISVALFDTINLLIVEITEGGVQYPKLNPDDTILFDWKEEEKSFFLYNVKNDPELRIPYIYPEDSISIVYDSNLSSARMPIQINTAFNPSQELPVERVLYGTYNDKRFLELTLYGTGIVEDYRYINWLTNFGIKLHVVDAVSMKEYDIKESKPDWKHINEKRKELLVGKEEFFPYVGSYIGLINIIDIFGYRDLLEVKEYLVKRNLNAPEYNDYTLFSINELLERGVANIYNSEQISLNRTTDDIKDMYAKTGFLALTYKFTIPSEETNDLGLPIIETTSDFTPDEVFFKLYRLRQILEKEYLPTNILIRDIIGEYIFFNNYILKNWKDDIDIRSYIFQQDLTITKHPDFHRDVIDLNIFRRKEYVNGIDFPRDRINNSDYDFINREQNWTPAENAALIDIIEDYYKLLVSDENDEIINEIFWETYNDSNVPIGCPIIFELGFDPLNAIEYTNIITDDLNEYYTAFNIEYRNIFEVEWQITKQDDNSYKYSIRGHVDDYKKIGHFLPYMGTYDIQVIGYDLMGGYSNKWETSITIVSDSNPAIYALAKIPDKFTDKVSKLGNTIVEDYSEANGLNVSVNSLNRINDNPEISTHNLSWYNFKQNLNRYEIYESVDNKFVDYRDSTNKYKKWLGLYSKYNIELFNNDTIAETNHVIMDSYQFQDNYLTGWKFLKPEIFSEIIFNEKIRYSIPAYNDMDQLLDILNNEYHPIISMYHYSLSLTNPDVIIASSRGFDIQKLMFVRYVSALAYKMQGYYMLNDTKNPIADFFITNDGTAYDCVFGAPGKIEKSMYFNGEISYIDLGNPPAFSPKPLFDGRDGMSISLLFKTDMDLLPNTAYGLFAKSADSVITLNTDTNGDISNIEWNYDLSGIPKKIYSTKPLIKTQWYHLVVVKTSHTSKGNILQMYIDTVLEKEIDGASDNITESNCCNTFIGKAPLIKTTYLENNTNVQYNHFKGNIDEVVYWTRGLIKSEVDEIYNMYLTPYVGFHNFIEFKRYGILKDHKLTRYSIKGDEYTFGRPKMYSDKYVAELTKHYPNFREELLMLEAPLIDIVSGIAGTTRYWESKKNIHTDPAENKIEGNLPSVFYHNYFNLTKTKIFKNGFVFPKYIPVFYVINNISGKVYYEWIITDTKSKEEIIRVRGVPFLMWSFHKESIYEITVNIKDSNNNEFKKELKNYTQVLKSNDYIDYIEKEQFLRLKKIKNK